MRLSIDVRHFAQGAVLLGCSTVAVAQSGWGPARVDNWVIYQRNQNDTNQWTYWPRLYVPYRFDNGWTFTQRADLQMVYTDNVGPGNPTGGYSGGMGDSLIEEIFDTPEVAKDLSLTGTLRLVFPTGKQAPFGASQYQWALGFGATYRMPDVLGGTVLGPFVRYFWGFDPQSAGVTTVRKLTVFPGVTLPLNDRWTLLLYPENPIAYDYRSHTWVVPLDLQFDMKIDKSLRLGIGGAVNLNHNDPSSYRYIVDARLTVFF